MSNISKIMKTGSVLSRPRITEKATFQAGASNPVYTFEVSSAATKSEIVKEVKAKYKVTPVKVNVVSLPRKQIFVRGKKGMTTAVKKALVFLKAGEKIELA